jgi:DNA-binding CsgD family transcriptional regulator
MSFNKFFNRKHPDFIGLLLEKNSDLSPREILICMYLKFNYSNNDISKEMGISRPTVDTYRHRVRKKLNLKRSDSIVSILNRL